MKIRMRWILLPLAMVGSAFGQTDTFLLLNAEHENVACLAKGHQTDCSNPCGDLFLRQGHRSELRIVNRRFLTDYTISIDGVTQVRTGVQIRNLEEAANLKVPVAPPAAPVAKGGVEVIRSRSAADILNALTDETAASQTQADLDADVREIERERARITAELRAFRESYQLMRGVPGTSYPPGSVAGSPNLESLLGALKDEYAQVTSGPWQDKPFRDENKFRDVNTQVQDLLAAAKLLGTALAASNLPQASQAIDADITQYEKNVGTLQANIEAALDGARLFKEMIQVPAALGKGSVGTELRVAQIKALLIQKLKAADQKAIPDDAELNALVQKYAEFLHTAETYVKAERAKPLVDAAKYARGHLPPFDEFKSDLRHVRKSTDIELPSAVEEVNAAQGRLLTRVNFIYDHSAVDVPLVKQIDLSGHSGNSIVYFTIRRVESFPRYTVPQIQGLGGSSTAAPAAGTALPAPAAGGNTTPPAPAPASAPPAGGAPAAPAGIVVAHSQFEVHDFYHATVVGFFTFGFFKDQSFVKQAASTTGATVPAGCTGTATDANCYIPVAINSLFQSDVVFGPLYYIRPTDTFPGAKRDWKQKTGVFGGVSATRLNHYYAGIGYEPKIGVQLLAGVHVGTTFGLQKPYTEGTAADISGDFPTQSIHRVGFFLGAGFDLNIFRKIFGSVTGVGTAASGTQGQ
jgi:hypothetical protein